MMQIDIVTHAMDIMAGYELLGYCEKLATLQLFIDSLGNYPKPREKGNTTVEPPSNVISAYLYVSMARSVAKTSIFGHYDKELTPIHIHRHLMNALTLLIEYR